jgi:hypothetical protein
MGKDANALRDQFQTRLAPIARQLGREVYPDGLPPGTKFSELEAIAGALGDEIARQRIEVKVREQADDWPEAQGGECPVCGGPARQAPDEPRVLTTTRGDVAWKERVSHCPRCRRAFFPSGPSVGPGSHRLQPPRATEDDPCRGQQQLVSASGSGPQRAERPGDGAQARGAADQADRPRTPGPAGRRRRGVPGTTPDGAGHRG